MNSKRVKEKQISRNERKRFQRANFLGKYSEKISSKKINLHVCTKKEERGKKTENKKFIELILSLIIAIPGFMRIIRSTRFFFM